MIRKPPVIASLVAAIALIGGGAASAAPGDVDTSWTGCGGSAGTACTGSNGLDYFAFGLGLDPNGSIRVATGSNSFNGAASGGRFKRLASDGTLDPGWPTTPGFTGDSYASAYDATNNRIFVAGNFTSYNNGSSQQRDFLARLTSTGALDASFQGCYLNDCATYNGLNTTAYAVALDGSNIPIVGGSFGGYNFGSSPSSYVAGIVKLTSGDIASGWVCRGGITASTAVRAIAVQADGKIIIGGDFTDYGNQPGVGTGCVAGGAGTRVTRSLIARLNADGSLDTTWTACGTTAGEACTGTNGLRTTGAGVRAIKLQPDGKILVGGTFTQFNGSPANYVMRLNADGTRDSSFMVPPASGPYGPSSAVQSIELNPTGRIYIGGAFNFVNGTTCRKVARLLEDGTLDPSFTCAFASGDGNVNAVAYDTTSRRLYVGGEFTAIGGTNRSYIAALSGVSAPSAPLSPSATAGSDLDVDVQWSPPASSDGLSVTGYTVTGSPSGSCTTNGATQCTVQGLTAGTPYTFTVTATSSAGVGQASSATAAVTPVGTPSAPTGLTATAGDGRASIAFTPGADNGSAITNYEYSLDGVSWTAVSPAATTSPVAITGLTNGTAYSIRLRAVSALGSGAASSPVSVTPAGSGSNANQSSQGGSGGSVVPPVKKGVLRLGRLSSSIGPTSATIATRVSVNEPGRLTLRAVRTTVLGASALEQMIIRGRGGVSCTDRVLARTAGSYSLSCALGASTRAALQGSAVRVRVAVTFAPTAGGAPVTRTQVVRIAKAKAPGGLPVTG